MKLSPEIQNTNSIEELIQEAQSTYLPEKHSIPKIFHDCEINLLFEKYEEFIEKYKIRYRSDISIELLKLIPKTQYNIARIKEYAIKNDSKPEELLKQCLFQCTTKGGKALNEILDETRKNNSEIYEAMKQIVHRFMESKKHGSFNEEGSILLQKMYNLDSKSPGIPLNIYIRNGHGMDHPEIAELLVIFLDKMTEEKKFKFLSRVQIIPRIPDAYKPNQLLSQSQNTSYLTVNGQEFINAINGGVTLHLSHSTNKIIKMPHIVSGSMEQNKNSYFSPIECEDACNKPGSKLASEYSCWEILEIYFQILQKIEKNLEKQLPGNNFLKRIRKFWKK